MVRIVSNPIRENQNPFSLTQHKKIDTNCFKPYKGKSKLKPIFRDGCGAIVSNPIRENQNHF